MGAVSLHIGIVDAAADLLGEDRGEVVRDHIHAVFYASNDKNDL